MNFLVRQKFITYIIHIIYIYTYVYKSFSTMLDKGLRNNIKKKRETEKLENINKMNE